MLLTTIWICFFISSSLAIEEPIRAQNLKPRHFNPHPFQNSPNRRSDRVGPVVFNEDQSLQRPPPVQDIPYLKVVKKYKKKKVGRFDVEEKHHPNYAFSYKVLDHSSGDDFSHSQVQDSRTTNGEYRVKLPDGRLQIVSYTADQNGYKADVKYMESEDIEKKIYHPSPVYHQIQRLPIREHPAVKANRKHYYHDVQANNHHRELAKFSSIVPTVVPVPVNYNQYDGDYGNIVVTPSPGYSNGVAANAQLPLPLNVQIFTTNARDYHNPGSYVPIVASTPHTYHSKDISHYRQHPISPQIINNGDQGIVVPLSTPSSFVLTDQHGQVIDNIKLVTSTAVPYVVSSTPMPHFVRIHSTASPSRRYN
ncbi:uncharacterized protein [Diabrotica undecimpunctata]|uniref:uncharacterized protein isoform X2 n=1 Tax=Diabrotica undecimpunctata TaxID=50387 RepID=UPI003B6397B8